MRWTQSQICALKQKLLWNGARLPLPSWTELGLRQTRGLPPCFPERGSFLWSMAWLLATTNRPAEPTQFTRQRLI